jgi:hypothetical protein
MLQPDCIRHRDEWADISILSASSEVIVTI